MDEMASRRVNKVMGNKSKRVRLVNNNFVCTLNSILKHSWHQQLRMTRKENWSWTRSIPKFSKLISMWKAFLDEFILYFLFGERCRIWIMYQCYFSVPCDLKTANHRHTRPLNWQNFTQQFLWYFEASHNRGIKSHETIVSTTFSNCKNGFIIVFGKEMLSF